MKKNNNDTLDILSETDSSYEDEITNINPKLYLDNNDDESVYYDTDWM